MGGEQSGEKTEEPTHKKLEDARKKGQVWMSQDLTGVGVFLVGLGVVKALWGNIRENVDQLFHFAFDQLSHPQDLQQAVLEQVFTGLIRIVSLTAPVVLAAAAVGALLSFVQVGPLLSFEAIEPKFENIDPIAGIKNLFNKKQAVALLMNLLKLIVTGWVVYGVVKGEVGALLGTIHTTPDALLSVLGELAARIVIRVCLCLLAFAIFDVWWQQHSYMKDMMMTKDEVKKDYKESEGDPHHKAKRKEFHMEILEGAQMAAVADSDVVVTNPDHVAVALKYDKLKDHAPKVIAKGVDHRAEQIKELARTSDVAILRNVPLAHALLRVDVNEDIPEDLYDAVAEVLNFVYRLKTGEVTLPVRAS